MRSMRWIGLLALSVVLIGARPEEARANGRFPEAQRLVEDPRDAARLYLTGTYGLLLTEDRGSTWFYVCESAFALNFVEGDPLFEVLADGALLGGIYETLNRSSDCGCSWSAVLGQPDTENVVDVVRDGDGALLALVEDYADFPARYRLFESTDEGITWQNLADLPDDVPRAHTFDVAPSDPSRIYVSAYVEALAEGVLLVSEDRGQSWEARAIPGTSVTVVPYIAGVDPNDPARVFVRTDHWDNAAEFAARDALLVTSDAGATFVEVLRREAKLLGFALSPDGATVLAGYGDPVLEGLSTNSEDFGIYQAEAATLTFERISELPVGCLEWTNTGLYVCAIQGLLNAPAPPGSLLFTPNAEFGMASAAPLEPLLDVAEVAGPLGCTAAICQETWTTGLDGTPAVCRQLRARCEIDPNADNVVCAPDRGANESEADEPTCGCALPAQSRGTQYVVGLMLLIGMLALRRRAHGEVSSTRHDGRKVHPE
jgi:photosystem II stability/assembly factor-like uncharacterized protein